MKRLRAAERCSMTGVTGRWSRDMLEFMGNSAVVTRKKNIAAKGAKNARKQRKSVTKTGHEWSWLPGLFHHRDDLNREQVDRLLLTSGDRFAEFGDQAARGHEPHG